MSMKRTIVLATTLLIAVGCSMKEDVVTAVKDDITTHDSIITIVDSNGVVIGTDTVQVDDSTGIVVDIIDGTQGVLIESSRTEEILFSTDGSLLNRIVGSDTVKASDIRKEIDKEKMSLAQFFVTNLKVNGLADFESFAVANKDQRMVMTVSVMLPGGTPEVAIVTPSVGGVYPVATIGELHNGLSLFTKDGYSGGLYAKNGALTSFESKLKDLTVSDIVFTVELQFVDSDIAVPADYKLGFTITGSNKKPL